MCEGGLWSHSQRVRVAGEWVCSRRSTLDSRVMNVDHEIQVLIAELQRLGKPNAQGQVAVRGAVHSESHVRDACCSVLILQRPLGRRHHLLPAQVPFGVLVRDERCGDLFEALVGTLRAAKKRKVVTYDGELLLQGVHDAVDVVLLKTTAS